MASLPWMPELVLRPVSLADFLIVMISLSKSQWDSSQSVFLLAASVSLDQWHSPVPLSLVLSLTKNLLQPRPVAAVAVVALS